MSGWLQPIADAPGLTAVLELPHLHVSVLRLASGERAVLRTGSGEETALAFAAGRCSATAGGRFWANAGTALAAAPWMRLARHGAAGKGVSDAGPASRPRRRIAAEFRPLTSTTPWPGHQVLWVGPDTAVELQALEETEIILFAAELGAAASQATGRPAELYGPNAELAKEIGTGPSRRLVTPLLTPGEESVGLAIGETYNPPGGWSTYPPHRHDRAPRRSQAGDEGSKGETQHEEVYVFRFAPAEGFGLVRLYDDHPASGHAYDTAMVFRHADALAIPGGFHTVCAAPGYHLHYLWALAGPRPERAVQRPDPEHAWVEAEG